MEDSFEFKIVKGHVLSQEKPECEGGYWITARQVGDRLYEAVCSVCKGNCTFKVEFEPEENVCELHRITECTICICQDCELGD